MGEEIMGLMDHGDRYPQLSRDWQDMDCKAKACRFNKLGKCITPSIAEIGDDGRCTGFSPEVSVPGLGGIGDVTGG